MMNDVSVSDEDMTPEDVSVNDEDMTPEEFDRRFGAGEPVTLRRERRPVSVIVRRVRIVSSESTIPAELASNSSNAASATPDANWTQPQKTADSRVLITSGSPTT
jgi:hypothetical protein